MIHFFNKKGARIKKEAWKQLRKKDSYSIIRQYCNDDIMISAEWTGEADSRTAPADRKLFTIFVHNNVHGSWIKDVSLTNTFHSEETMDVAFEDLLLRFTDSELDEEEGVIEKGNMLETTKEEPIKPEYEDEPSSSDDEVVSAPSSSISGLGAWS
ncbi:hypothetical protein ABXV18_24675 [Vibrio owensii]|uniref:hypothetical protein n=1 Tax=Vibrio owensii TaxID=696485 RepID=UPI0033932968